MISWLFSLLLYSWLVRLLHFTKSPALMTENWKLKNGHYGSDAIRGERDATRLPHVHSSRAELSASVERHQRQATLHFLVQRNIKNTPLHANRPIQPWDFSLAHFAPCDSIKYHCFWHSTKPLLYAAYYAYWNQTLESMKKMKQRKWGK